MCGLRFIPLYEYQRVHLEHVLEIVEVENLWLELEDCCDSLGEIAQDKKAFVHFISRGGCAYYYHLLSRLKCHKVLSSLVTNCSPESLFRHVYLYVENEEPVILSKGALWFADESQCRKRALNYEPSIDITPEGGMLLTVENCHPHFPEMSHSLKNAFNTLVFTSDCSGYERAILENEVIVKMPWKTGSDQSTSKPMNIFCLQNVDVWFYSYSNDLLTAYHEHIHRT